MQQIIPRASRISHVLNATFPSIPLCRRLASTGPDSQTHQPSTREHDVASRRTQAPRAQGQGKSIAQLDEELRQKMSGIAGDGGEAGVEYEDGKPAAMKRSVRNNMFRYI
ncbi:hypothetical protein SAMD00023353_7900310 [Rosellinia necatrix]|uniref:Uncharacterized protein n=1 Tax=Rosellinia necatrix TaxID=77044 RepID=A0A1W2TUX9_ROSNE|nr:hypothetical protein SAMD00023353_7900310 [Rosellinia necatrix]